MQDWPHATCDNDSTAESGVMQECKRMPITGQSVSDFDLQRVAKNWTIGWANFHMG
jgi:hypothetical protein